MKERERDSERASKRERERERERERKTFLIATKPACISAQADIVLARALASLTGICARTHTHVYIQ